MVRDKGGHVASCSGLFRLAVDDQRKRIKRMGAKEQRMNIVYAPR